MSSRPLVEAAQLNRGALGSAMASVGRHLRRRLVLVVAFSASCALHPPTLTTKALGCYSLVSAGWSDQAARVTGFAALPARVALDSVFIEDGGRRVIVPSDWQIQGVHRNVATWDNTLPAWRRLDDSIVGVPAAKVFHELAGDSIVVRWRGWGGGLTAYLAPTAWGYRGLAELAPRQLAQGARPIFVELHRTSCAPSS